MNLSEYAEVLQTDPRWSEGWVFHHYIPPQQPNYGPGIQFPEPVQKRLQEVGPEKLYSHQVEAIEHLRRGNNVLVATPTASGKSLIYNLCLLEEVSANRDSRALYISPLKALEHDQLERVTPWLKGVSGEELTADIYDGDTPANKRKRIKSRVPHILLTNPDMLHRAILAYHQSWKELFGNLSLVIMDEIHAYRGIFGSHVNQLIQRLKRLCSHYGGCPRFILLSGTISNPEEFGKSLIGEELRVVRSEGAPRSGQHVLLFNPRSSANFSSAKLFVDSIRRGFRTIAFTQSRQVTELIHVWTLQLSADLRRKVSSYRSGFLPSERREIERGLAAGNLLGVVSTSALEMGIDIGYLDVCLLVGYPGTIINTWQRGGRVGRGGRDSMLILVAKPDALDQYFMKHPEELFERSYEAAVLDPYNRQIVEAHLPCAASERPITLQDEKYWGAGLRDHLESLERQGLLNRTAEGEPAWFASRKKPQLGVDIRSTGDTYTIFEKETGQAIGTVDGVRAFKECHPGAMYLHRARQYLIDLLLVEKKDIIAGRSRLRCFTRARTEKETEVMETLRHKSTEQFVIREGRLKVTEKVIGYEKRALPGQELLGVIPLDLPPRTFETRGFWVEIEDELKGYVEKEGLDFMGGIHAIEHAMIAMFPLFALCDRNDLGGICYPYHPQVGKGAVFIYDSYPGGIGLSERGYEIIAELLQKTFDHVNSCGCEEGCPSCIHSPKCGSGNKPLDKKAGLLILGGFLGHISLSETSTGVVGSDQPQSPAERFDPGTSQKALRVLFLDLETQKMARDVGGWGKTHLMRVSVAVVFDRLENRFFVYQEEEMNALFGHLQRADLVIGFNIKGFDYRVLGPYTNIDLEEIPTFDILEDINNRLGYRLSLDHLARETLRRGKTGHGLQAVEWYRQGEMDKLIEYCRRDVGITRDLFEYGLKNSYLVFKEKGEHRRVRLMVDWDLNSIIESNKIPSVVDSSGRGRNYEVI